MAPPDRKQQVKDYVRERLRAEVRTGKRGTSARLSEALGISTAHVANLTSDPPSRQPGEDVARSAAAYWGISYAKLEAIACGDVVNASELPEQITRTSDRVHHVIDRVGKALRFTHEEIELAGTMVRGLAGTSGMTDEIARELLDRARLYRRDATRMFPSATVVEDTGSSALDDLSGGRATTPSRRRSKK